MQQITQVDEMIATLRQAVHVLKTKTNPAALKNEEAYLIRENAVIRQKIAALKQRLVKAEINNGLIQIMTPVLASHPIPPPKPEPEVAPQETRATLPVDQKKADPVVGANPDQKQQQAKPRPAKKEAGATSVKAEAGGAAEVVDVSRLDMRIGRILEVERHPDADSLYVEKVDVGEPAPRTIVSGLVKYVTLEEMRDRLGVFLLNLKPAKMRGVNSEGMIMCASAPEQGMVEPIGVPPGVVPGDRVQAEGYPANPDPQLNPKKKIWEQVKPDLRIDTEGFAAYKGARWQVVGKSGPLRAPTLKDVQIA